MQERIRDIQALSTVIRREVGKGISDRIDPKLRSLFLIENPQMRKVVDKVVLRRIRIEVPPFLEEGRSAILVSNYPSVGEATDAVLKVDCCLSGKESRLRAIGREEVAEEAGVLLMALGVDRILIPAQKVDGVYRLKEGKEAYNEVLNHLRTPGSVFWLSITGETRGNGLLEEDLKTGAVMFSLESKVPIVPMGIVTKQGKVVEVRFGNLVILPKKEDLKREYERGDFLNDCTRKVMAEIASLLPPGQRGSFDNMDIKERLAEIDRRLKIYTTL